MLQKSACHSFKVNCCPVRFVCFRFSLFGVFFLHWFPFLVPTLSIFSLLDERGRENSISENDGVIHLSSHHFSIGNLCSWHHGRAWYWSTYRAGVSWEIYYLTWCVKGSCMPLREGYQVWNSHSLLQEPTQTAGTWSLQFYFFFSGKKKLFWRIKQVILLLHVLPLHSTGIVTSSSSILWRAYISRRY